MLSGQTSLVIVDIEGAEGQLLNPETVPGLTNAHVIVEIHDIIDRRLGETFVVAAEIKPCSRRSANSEHERFGIFTNLARCRADSGCCHI